MKNMLEDYNPMSANSSYRMVISTSKSNFALEGSYENVLNGLKAQLKKNRKTSMVELEVTTLETENSTHFNQEIRKKSSLFILVRFEKPVDENQAILGVLQDELDLITQTASPTFDGVEDDYKMIVQTSGSNSMYDGTYKVISDKLKNEIRVNGLTSMVELDISSVTKGESKFFNQRFSKKTTLLTLIRFEHEIDEMEAVFGLLSTELSFLNR